MKKIMWIVIAAMLLTLTACGAREESDRGTGSKTSEAVTESKESSYDMDSKEEAKSEEVADFGFSASKSEDSAEFESPSSSSEVTISITGEADTSYTVSEDAVSVTVESKTESKDEGRDLVIVEPDEPDYRPQAGQLTAGEWNDNDNFQFFMNVLNNNRWYQMKSHWEFNHWDRFEFEVYGNSQQPLVGATITLLNEQDQKLYSGRTNNEGYVALYPYLHKNRRGGVDKAKVDYGNSSYSFNVSDSSSNGINKITLQEVNAIPVEEVDIMLMIDTTGSMGDELEYLKAELQYVIQQVERNTAQQLDIRLSANFYRDIGDQYVVRSFYFTGDLQAVMEQIGEQIAEGGGDFEEAVVLALEDAIYNHQWREEAGAKLLFLVLDAPPHHTDDNLVRLHEVTDTAVEQGIRIIPVASSGIDKETEFLLRFMETKTNGTYVFLTDHSGIGGEHIEPTIGQYSVEHLNDLLIRVIGDYIR